MSFICKLKKKEPAWTGYFIILAGKRKTNKFQTKLSNYQSVKHYMGENNATTNDAVITLLMWCVRIYFVNLTSFDF